MPDLQPVLLVGAGPGDPRLITLAGADALRRADVVLYDRLAAPELLDLARHADGHSDGHADGKVQLIDVGKAPGGQTVTQDDINQMLIDHARRGRRVVRLKGGDPFVFGRGGEEASALTAAGIPVRVIPGVTSATAAAAAAGIAVTDRRASSSVTIVTGSDGDGGAEPIDWHAVANVGGVIVLMMAWRSIEHIAARLIDAGLSAQTPAAAIERATTPQQRVITAPIAELSESARTLNPPVTVVIGPTVPLAHPVADLPLAGWRIVVTRPAAQSASMIERLRALGSMVIALPTIEIRPRQDAAVDAAVQRLADGQYHYVALTSVNGVDTLWNALQHRQFDARAFAGVRIAAIGSETARALSRRGLQADVVPAAFTSTALSDRLAAEDLAGKRVLLARAALGSPVLRERLADAGARVDDVAFYDTVTPTPDPDALAELRHAADLVTLTSPSTAQGLVRMLRDTDSAAAQLDSLQAVCIGPVSAAAARQLGLSVAAVADVYTVDGLIDAVLQLASEHPSGLR